MPYSDACIRCCARFKQRRRVRTSATGAQHCLNNCMIDEGVDGALASAASTPSLAFWRVAESRLPVHDTEPNGDLR